MGKKNNFVDLYTVEGEKLLTEIKSAEKSGAVVPHKEYPRPQMKRSGEWINLNGFWDFAMTFADGLPEAEDYKEKILVPFAPEALLSGLHRGVPKGASVCYKRSFELPDEFEGEAAKDKRILLHIGAADQIAEVYFNGVWLGNHDGGYEHFSFDITSVVNGECNELVIKVSDHPDKNVLPYGKQSEKRGGMWYTPVTGIWQTVWIESVPQQYIKNIDIKTGSDYAEITVHMTEGEKAEVDAVLTKRKKSDIFADSINGKVIVPMPAGDIVVPLVDNFARIDIDNPQMWSPENPYLYNFKVCAGDDEVESYFALRTLTIEKVDNLPRLCLNGKPYFFHGLLDQGYWSDGLFTPADMICYEKDILAMKSLGFNTLRKHIKVEPEQFYYDCDRLGMIVFQDMVNNGDYSFIRDTAMPTIGIKKRNDKKMHQSRKSRQAFISAMESTVSQLKNHPCICYWTIFNEGWGQFDSNACYLKMKELDDARFIATYSGWFKGAETDVETEHVYFKPFKMQSCERPLVLSEFGGYAYMPQGHAFNPGNEYGYKMFKDRHAYEDALISLYEHEIVPAVAEGLCGAIYTQVSDVEDETNGLVSYDRKVTKVSADKMQKLAEKLRIK